MPNAVPDEDWLAVNPLSALSSGAPQIDSELLVKDPRPENSDAPPAHQTSEHQQSAESHEGTDSPNTPDTQASLRDVLLDLARPDTGGWRIDDGSFAIKYQVAEHADPLMKNWIELAVAKSANDPYGWTKQFDSSLAPGNCRSCHAARQGDSGLVSVNWQPAYRNPLVRDFTRFSHRPHMNQPGLEDCTSCHVLDSRATNSAVIDGNDTSHLISDFAPIVKASCATCHRAGAARSGCTDCHNYHIGSRVLRSR